LVEEHHQFVVAVKLAAAHVVVVGIVVETLNCSYSVVRAQLFHSTAMIHRHSQFLTKHLLETCIEIGVDDENSVKWLNASVHLKYVLQVYLTKLKLET
jgi:hypothetical protein